MDDMAIENICAGNYIAHVDPDEERVQLLADHLHNTAYLAEKNCPLPELKSLARLILLLHDAGKLREDFQEDMKDILEKGDDHEVGDEELDTIVSWIKGEKGTEVTLYVLRDGKEETLTATRDTIEAQTVEYEMKDGRVGYIRVSEFDLVTYDQFKAALDDLENQGMEGLVIDLRNNPGGNLDVVCNMLKLLLPEGTIVSTKDKNGKTDKITCDGTNEFKKPLAVLVNQYSASASEIFSGAIQDYGTGKIVGVTTYGKGVVQQLLDLGDGTCFKVTIAEYYTPSGKSINKKGVEPDIEVEYQYDEADPKKDNQLDKALETVSEELK